MARRTHVGTVPAQFVEPVGIDTEQRRVVAMAASVLLSYPDERFAQSREIIGASLPELPAAIADEFRAFLAATASMSLRELEEHYVETFDQRRRCSLFLSYYSVGDTRQRGTAILAFRQQLRGLGIEEQTQELPDHLCVLLEALARVDDARHDAAVEMIASHREGIEVLRSALENIGSPYVHVIIAVAKSLPRVDEETVFRYIDLIKSGPPAEMVGITQLPFPTMSSDVNR